MVYLQDHISQTPSLANSLVKMTPPGTPLLGPVIVGLPVTNVELYPKSNNIRTFLYFALPLCVFIHTCIMG